MNENEIELKVQALVDGELTGREAKALQQRINDDAKLQQLHERLTQMRGLIADSELPRPLPESADSGRGRGNSLSAMSPRICVSLSCSCCSLASSLMRCCSAFASRPVSSPSTKA